MGYFEKIEIFIELMDKFLFVDELLDFIWFEGVIYNLGFV